MSIAVLVPSRSRPDRFTQLLDSIETTAHGHVAVYCGLDADDPYEWYYPARPSPHTYVHGPRKGLAAWTNHLATLAIADGHSILASFGDDHRPRTPGWDLLVADAMERQPGLVYTRDGLQDERLPTAPFWPAGVVLALGWFFPPVLGHMYADNWWKQFAQDLGRCTFLPDVLIEHMHPSAGKAEADALTVENDSHYETDHAAYIELVTGVEHRQALQRVRSACGF